MERQIAVTMAQEPIRILIVAEVRLYREGLSATLAEEPRVQVVGLASAFDEAIAHVHAQHPQVVVLDVGIRRSLALVRAIREASPLSRIVAFAIAESDYEIVACAEAGVSGYVTVDSSIAELTEAIESAAHGELKCTPKIAAVLVKRLSTLSAPAAQGSNRALLTSREREIAVLIEQGLSNKQIAARLHIEIATVKNHVHNILDKLRVTTRGEVGAQLRRTMPRRSLRPTPPSPFPAPVLGI